MTKGKPRDKTHHLNKDAKKRFKYKFLKRSKKIGHKNKKAQIPKNLASNSTKAKEQMETKNISTKETFKTNSKEKASNIFEGIENEYMEKFLDIYYDTYSDNFLYKSLEKLNQNKKVVTEEILSKYGISEERRKYVLNYFLLFIDEHKISSKLYFLTVSLFDSFLINYAESNNDIKCHQLFLSKTTKEFSDTKLMLCIFCCYYIIAKYYNTNLLTIDDLLKYKNAKDEVTYDDLFYLIQDIIVYTDCNIDILNIYSFAEIYLFQIRRCLKDTEWDNYQQFMEILEKSVSFLGAKIGRKILLLNIEESIQALGLMIFCYQLCKFRYEVSTDLDKNVHNLLVNLKDCLMNYYGANKLPIIIDWLNDNWNK